MGTVLLPHSVFIHIPKTGGNWVNVIIKDTKIKLIEPKPHPILSQLDKYKDYFRFAFVRDPITWWKSRWRFRMGKPRNLGECPSCPDQCLDADFNKFIENVLERCPGYCGDFYEKFVGTPDNEIEFIGRFENMQQDLMKALDLAKESYKMKLIHSTPPKNKSQYRDVEFPKSLKQALQDAEKKAIERFGY